MVTTHDSYPLPTIQDFAANLHSCSIFLKIDLMKGYHNVPVPTTSILKMVIVTPFELFEYVFILFGLHNSAQSFQHLMDKIFRDLGFPFT